MLPLKRVLFGAAALTISLGSAISAHADVTFTNLGTGALGSWSTVPGSPIYVSQATPGTATTAQGSVGTARRLSLVLKFPSDRFCERIQERHF